MSGGFFRGTSADQDTRFSNKQAKLLKSQKFAPELEHLVDVTKVKMDVIRPWIATRATELLGFEDEVLINFIYGLLEGKEVDGKQIQIQLTGFMEKNTGKFMRELWGLLLSAQKNASGVPQQFLDAKEEEMKKKKVETDRITQEIQKRKERGGWESEQDRKSRMDGQIDIPGQTDLSRNANFDADAVLEQSSRRSTSVDPEDEVGRRQSSRRMSRSTPSSARSGSRSFSNSRSHSRGRHSSRSPSISPPRQRHSDSHEMRYRSPPRRSFSPWQIARSPSRRRSPRYRRRSSSRTRYRSPPLVRRRTPERRRILERRSSPSLRYRSPPSPRRSSPPLRRRSPVHSLRKSPSPLRRRSPMQHRTPPRRRSPSPLVRRSPPFRSLRGRSKSPTRRKMDSQSSPRRRNRNHRLSESQSPPSRSRKSLSGGPDGRVSRSPVRQRSEREEVRLKNSGQKGAESVSRKQPISLRSPQRDPRSQRDALGEEAALSAMAENSESPFQELSLKANEKREGADRGKLATNRSKETQDHSVYRKMSSDHKKSYVDHSERRMRKNSPLSDEIENGSRRLREESFSLAIHDKQLPEQEISPRNGRPSNQQSLLKSPTLKGSYKSDDIKQKYYNEFDHSFEHHTFMETEGKTGHNIKEGLINSDSEDDARYKRKIVERSTKRSDIRKEASDEEGNDSQVDEKEAKRRRKDEKRLRKEEKRRKREERHRKKEERHAGKRAKYVDTVTPPSDYDKSQNAADDSDGDVRKRRNIHRSDTEEAESQQKKLEIELREKALESLRAKKAVTH